MIAIIGIIAATVLASLGTARSTGEDAATKSTLNSLRAQAELYSVKNDDSYDGFCLDSQTKQLLMGKTITCNDSPNEYAVSAKLNAEGYFCVDSASFTDVIKDDISLNQTLCNRLYNFRHRKIALRRTEGRGRICKIAHEAPSNG
jgi:type II secretory pathway pseudopilin PulG